MTNPMIAPLGVFSDCDGTLEVVQVVGEDQFSKRLAELGLCPGQKLRIVKSGDPAIVAVDGSRLAVAEELQNRVYVRPSTQL